MSRPIRSNRPTRKLSRSAFTLLEVMLVLVIIAAIAGIAVVNLGGATDRAYKNKTKAEIDVIHGFLDQYMLEVKQYPDALADLYEKPSGLADESLWTRISKKPIENDAWGTPYEYSSDGKTFELKSAGPNGTAGDEDDIS